MNIANIKRGSVCKYKVNGVDRYSIVLGLLECPKESQGLESTQYYTRLSILGGLKIENPDNFKDLLGYNMVDYRSLNYIRFDETLYFPINTIDNRGDIYITNNEPALYGAYIIRDIEIIGQLSFTQLVYMELYNQFSNHRKPSLGFVSDIEDVKNTELSMIIKRAVVSDNILSRHSNITIECSHMVTTDIANKINATTPAWIENYVLTTAHLLPEPTSKDEKYDSNKDYIKDIRDLKEGGIYSWRLPNNYRFYIYIHHNPTENMSDTDFAEFNKNHKLVNIDAFNVELYHEEGIFIGSTLFNTENKIKLYSRKPNCIRIDNFFYILIKGRVNNISFRTNGKPCCDTFGNFCDLKSQKCRFVRKLNSDQLIMARILHQHNMRGRIIDIDKLDYDIIRPDVQDLLQLETNLKSTVDSIHECTNNILTKVIGNDYRVKSLKQLAIDKLLKS